MPSDGMLITVASLCHDIGHPGRNNAFFINVCDPIAVIYNDQSVLENYHASLTFEILNIDEFALFADDDENLYRQYRETIVKLILATDMKFHFEAISQFKVRRRAPEFSISKNDDKWIIAKMCIKAADLSHGALEWSQHYEWSLLVTEEFYLQGDEEARLGLPKSPMCDREKNYTLCKGQVGFLRFVVEPLFMELNAIDTDGIVESMCLTRLKDNAEAWEVKDQEETAKTVESAKVAESIDAGGDSSDRSPVEAKGLVDITKSLAAPKKYVTLNLLVTKATKHSA